MPNKWDGTITVSKTGWLITPGSKTYSNVSADIPNDNYVAYQPKISGTVTKQDGTPLQGAVLTANNSGGTATTNASGYYEITVPYNWSGVAAVSRPYWSFAPTNLSYSNVATDQITQNYNGSYLGLDGSGTQDYPYLINSLTAFDEFVDVINAAKYWVRDVHTKLTTDIDLSDRTYSTALISPDTNPGSANFQGTWFGGVFDGNNFAVRA